eukprot:m.37815 g.37815  ORF g.37815 m.37815 type:complete len:193 (-) comp11136_c0_seq2:1055-1633(-)
MPLATCVRKRQKRMFRHWGQYEASGKQILLDNFLNSSLRLARVCAGALEPAKAVPRQYRATRKEAPTSPSAYVGDVLKPLAVFATVDGDTGAWVCPATNAVSEKFAEIVAEVLSSVKKTEDSLLRLKKLRKAASAAEPTVSDDDKIRQQLLLDARAYAEQVRALNVEGSSSADGIVQSIEAAIEERAIAKAS